MRHLSRLLLLLLLLASCKPQPSSPVALAELQQLLSQKSYFKLRDLLAQQQNQLEEHHRLYYEAFVLKAFGQNEGSNQHISILLSKHAAQFNDSLTLGLLDLQAANHLFLYQYQQAAALYTQILADYPQLLEEVDRANYLNNQRLFGSFAGVPPQKMHKSGEVRVAAYRNAFNHLMCPVTVQGQTNDFIFDTGANLSTISESTAQKMKLRLFDQAIELGSSTQISVQATLAVADSLYLGELLFENVVFLVLPDAQLSFPEIDYHIEGIIGFPVMHQMGEVHLHSNGELSIPAQASATTRSNMFFEGLNPVVEVRSDSDTLLFTFDTGAKSSELSYRYYQNHQDEVQQKGELQSNQSGGVGGLVTAEEYMLRNFPLQLGSKQASLVQIPVKLEEYGFNKYFDGNLGQDLFTQFNTLILNFEGMYVDFE